MQLGDGVSIEFNGESEEAFIIAEKDGWLLLCGDGTLRIYDELPGTVVYSEFIIAEDNMRVDVVLEGMQRCAREDLVQVCQAAGIKHGLRPQGVSAVLRPSWRSRTVCLAQGGSGKW